MDRHFFFLAYLTANKQQRRWLVIIWAVVPLLFALAMFLTLSPYRGISYQYQESYPIVGTENRQLWTLKGSELVTLFNENLPDTAPELSYLHEPTPSDRQIMLTDNGKTWSIVFRQVPEDAASIYFWSKQPEIDAWLGNVEDVKLSLYHTSAQDILLNEQYARCLINIFTPETEIVGGNMAAAGDYIMLPLKSSTNKYSLNLVYKDTKFRLSKLIENA